MKFVSFPCLVLLFIFSIFSLNAAEKATNGAWAGIKENFFDRWQCSLPKHYREGESDILHHLYYNMRSERNRIAYDLILQYDENVLTYSIINANSKGYIFSHRDENNGKNGLHDIKKFLEDKGCESLEIGNWVISRKAASERQIFELRLRILEASTACKIWQDDSEIDE